jgi:hypothetical protein
MCTHFNQGIFTFAHSTNLEKSKQLREEYNELWFSSQIVFLIVNPEISKEIYREQMSIVLKYCNHKYFLALL